MTARELTLQPLSERHLAGMAAVIADPEVLRFTRVPEPPPAGYERTWLARYEAGRRDGTREAFAAVGPDGAFLGLGLAPDIRREHREVELGYLVAPGVRGRGVGTEILRQLTAWAFTDLGALRLTLLVDVANGASQRVAERCGYEREGVMRSMHLKGDTRVDTTLWSRLPGDPPPPASGR